MRIDSVIGGSLSDLIRVWRFYGVAGARFLVTLGFYLVHAAVYFTVARGLVSLTLDWSWKSGILAGLANAFVGVPLYFFTNHLSHQKIFISYIGARATFTEG